MCAISSLKSSHSLSHLLMSSCSTSDKKFCELWSSNPLDLVGLFAWVGGCMHGPNAHAFYVSSRMPGLNFAKLSANIEGL